MSKNFINNVFHNLINIPGWHTNRKIIVIESDDWGSIRMPSRETYEKFLKVGIRVDRDIYCRYDSLATKDDMEALFDVLYSVKDQNGRHAIVTANTIVANPDFKKIRESDYKQYFYETFTETLKKNNNYDGVFKLWKAGIANEVFFPQFHGREHLNVKKWLQALKDGEIATKIAFDLETFGLTEATTHTINKNYMGAFDSSLNEDIEFYGNVIKDGLTIFKDIFGYQSRSFIATTYTWSPKIEPILKSNGIDYLQGLISQQVPLNNGDSFIFKKNNFQGKKNKSNQYYLMRNCFFEPTQFSETIDVVDDCLHRILLAFRWGKAAVIGAHRLNFIGAIDIKNREKNLVLFKNLLSRIIKIWPDAEFMNSVELGDLIHKQSMKSYR